MPEQEQKRIQKKGAGDGEAADDAGQVQSSNKAAELKDEMDEILGALSKRISPEARTQLGRTAAAAAAALRGFEAPPGRKVLLLLSGAWSLSVAPQLYSPLVEAANRLGYTVYPVDTSQSDAAEVTVLDKLARATGGRLVAPASNDAFREVVADSGSYYWLGFTPTWKADDQRRPVTVEVRLGQAVEIRVGGCIIAPARVVLEEGPERGQELAAVLLVPLAQRFGLSSGNWQIKLADNTKQPTPAQWEDLLFAWTVDAMSAAAQSPLRVQLRVESADRYACGSGNTIPSLFIVTSLDSIPTSPTV